MGVNGKNAGARRGIHAPEPSRSKCFKQFSRIIQKRKAYEGLQMTNFLWIFLVRTGTFLSTQKVSRQVKY